MKIEAMTDDEILEGIQEAFEEDGRLSLHYIDIEVVDGSITIAGRVTSEDELQIIDELLTDTLELEDVKNKVWVDETLSYEDPEDTAPDIKGLTFDDDEIDDESYTEEEEEEEEAF
ncbi:MAG: hypothetical protein ABII18_11960 [bacterium]|nr:BON domain-containing protein [bacterium]MBU1917833.1 BON domain-containing protein [bacterium]